MVGLAIAAIVKHDAGRVGVMAVREQHGALGVLKDVAARPAVDRVALVPDREAGIADVGAQAAARFEQAAVIVVVMYALKFARISAPCAGVCLADPECLVQEGVMTRVLTWRGSARRPATARPALRSQYCLAASSAVRGEPARGGDSSATAGTEGPTCPRRGRDGGACFEELFRLS
jgi:hypothetical protein